jgi:hypothetical protein
LSEERRLDAGAGLIAGPEIVAKRFDDVIRGYTDVKCPTLDHLQHGMQDADHGTERRILALGKAAKAVEMAEQLVCAVDQMDQHMPNELAPKALSGDLEKQPSSVSISRMLVRRVSRAEVQPGVPAETKLTNHKLKPQTEGDTTMRFMVIVKADKDSEAGVLPDRKLLAEMGKYNEELAKAGVMLAGEGLHASSKGARVKFSGKQRTVTDGPFSETKELVAGFWLWQVRSKEEAIEWLKRAPFDHEEVEIRQVFEAEDFGPEFTPELREQEERVRKQVAAKK